MVMKGELTSTVMRPARISAFTQSRISLRVIEVKSARPAVSAPYRFSARCSILAAFLASDFSLFFSSSFSISRASSRLSSSCCSLSFSAAKSASDPWGVPKILATTGGVFIAGGLLAGLNAIQKNEAVNDYTTKREEQAPISELIQARDQAAITADGLLIIGGASLLTAWIWSLTEADK